MSAVNGTVKSLKRGSGAAFLRRRAAWIAAEEDAASPGSGSVAERRKAAFSILLKFLFKRQRLSWGFETSWVFSPDHNRLEITSRCCNMLEG